LTALAPYLSPEEREARLRSLVEGGQGELLGYGQSVEGRPLLAGRLPRLGAGRGRRTARVLVTAGIHGPEYVGPAVVLALLERCQRDPELRRLRERAELWAIPCLNPDGYARVWARQGVGRLPELRPNAHGVDLNRNFPLPAGRRRLALPGAGSTQPGAATFVGEAPLSEPETAALARLLGEHRFVASTNGHSFMGTLIPAHVEDAPAARTYRALCRAFARAQIHTRYRRLASRFFDTFTGEMEDYQHHHHGIWAVCVETFSLWATFRQHLRAPTLFWRFNPREPGPWIDNDVPGITAFLHAALDRDRPVST
jgi:predicted deacylase